MGQFLSIGIVTKFSANTSEFRDQQPDTAEITQLLQDQGLFALDLYDYHTVSADFRQWTLKPELLQNELLPFLKAFYGISTRFYKLDQDKVIATLESTPFDQWTEIIAEQSLDTLQVDEYAQAEYLRLPNKRSKYVSVDIDTITLHMTEKIFLESDSGMFRFYTYCMHQTFANYPIARALRTYITG